MFLRPNNSMRGKCQVFTVFNQRNKASFVSLQYKPEQDSSGFPFKTARNS